MITHKIKTTFTIAALAIAGQLSAAETFYVAPNGKDTNPGTLKSPFATITQARDAVRKVNKDSKESVVVNIRGGVYHIKESIRFDHRDSGPDGQYITYRNYKDEKPVIIGGVPVTNWEPYKDGIMKANIGKDIEFWSLLVDGKLASIAKENKWKQPKSIRNVQAYYQGAWMSEYLKIKLNDKNQPVSDYPKSQFSGGLRHYSGDVEFISGPGEWAVNSDAGYLYYYPKTKKELDTVIRPTAKSVFTFKGESGKQPVSNIKIQGLEILLTDFNASMPCYSGTTIDGYERQNADYPETLRTSLILMENAKNIQVLDCDLHDAPLHAVSLYGWAQNNTVSGCKMTNLGYSGVYLAGLLLHKDNSEVINKANIISNNEISNIMATVNHATGVQIYQSAENIIEHNLIHQSRRYGISLKGARYGVRGSVGLGHVKFSDWDKYIHSNKNIFRYNYMYDLGADSADGGGIECWGGGRGNIVDNNIIINAYTGGPKGGWRGHSIFLDDGSDYWTIRDNIVYDTKTPAVNAQLMSKGVDNLIYNNVFDASLSEHGVANLDPYIEPARKLFFYNNIIYSDHAQKVHGDGGVHGNGADRLAFRFKDISSLGEMDYNIYFNKQGKFNFPKGGSSLSAWQDATKKKNADQNSKITDPHFINAKERDYRLKENSPALAMGMRSIDSSKVGLLKSFSFSPKNGKLHRVFLKSKGHDTYLEAKPGDTLQTSISGKTKKWYEADLSSAKFTYTSSDPAIASVDSKGLVTLKGTGRAVVTATVSSNGIEKSDDLVIYSGVKSPHASAAAIQKEMLERFNSTPKAVAGRIEAESFSKKSKGMRIESNDQSAHIGYIDNGHWIMFEGMEFPEGIKTFTARVACGNNNGGTIELRLGSASGKLLGSCRVEPTGGWANWEKMSSEVSGLSGKQDLYLVFTGQGSGMFNLDWFEFDKKVKWKK